MMMVVMLTLMQASGGSVSEGVEFGRESKRHRGDGTRSAAGQDGRHLSDVC